MKQTSLHVTLPACARGAPYPAVGRDRAAAYARRYTPGDDIDDGYEELLGRYSTKEFYSPKRSTVPFLEFWRDPDQRVREFFTFKLHDSIYLDFEHKVPVQCGKGKPSCTDLMLTSGDVSIAIEAKFTEPRYEDVAHWLYKSESANRRKVLDGWFELLRECSTDDFNESKFTGLPYQMIHRAASACYLKVENRWLAYQVFDLSKKKRDMYLNDLELLATALGDKRQLRICLIECSVQRTNRQKKLELKWNSGERNLSEQVLAGLRANDLFNVQLEQIVVV